MAASLAACATIFGLTSSSSYRVTKVKDLQTEIEISPDRIRLECFDIDGSDEFKGHRNLILFLRDEQDTVLWAIHRVTTDLKTCMERLDLVSKVVRSGRRITISGKGDPLEPRVVEAEKVDFGTPGRFPGNGRAIEIEFVSNERGECYGAFTLGEKPCPSGQFPINGPGDPLPTDTKK